MDMVQAPDFVSNVHHTGWLDARIAAQVRLVGWKVVFSWPDKPTLRTAPLASLASNAGCVPRPACPCHIPQLLTPALLSPCAQVRSERPPWHLSVICGTVLRALGRVSSRSAEYLSYLEKGQLPPARISLTTLREEFVVDGACWLLP